MRPLTACALAPMLRGTDPAEHASAPSMQPEIEQLLVIQDRDQRIRRLNRQQEQVPIERRRLEDGLDSASATLDGVRAEARQNEVDRKKLEIEVAMKQESIARFRQQQFQTRKNEEYQALAHEINRFESDISELETQELILMEAADEITTRTRAAQVALDRARAELEARVGDLEQRAANVAGELEQLREERSRLAAGIDPDLLDQYDRLFQSKGDTAVASVQHGVCGGCHMKVSANTAFVVRTAAAIIRCDHCGRILYASAD